MYNQIINKATSEYFASIIVTNFMFEKVSAMFKDVTFNRISNDFSIAYIPVEKFSTDIIYTIGYEALPKCFGLMSFESCNRLEGKQLNHNIETSEFTGKDVLVGFVDTGIDYRNSVFMKEDHTSRIVSIWDQSIDSLDKSPANFFYGTEYSKEEINMALGDINPLDIVPSTDEVGHGTVLASIAGGSYDQDNNFMGVAPNVEFVVVKLKPAKKYIRDFFCLPMDAITYQEDDIMLGINYLVQVAQELNRPMVICMGLGTSYGVGIMNEFLFHIGRLGNVAIVVAAGNEGNSGHHYQEQVNPITGVDDVDLVVGEEESDFFIKFIGNSPNTFSVDIFAPTGELLGRIPTFYTQTHTMEFKYKQTTILADNTIEYTLTGDQCMPMRFLNPAKGTWKFRVYGRDSMLSTFKIWLPIRNYISRGTFFINPDYYKTITIPGNEETMLTVVAYNSRDDSLYYYNSVGLVLDKGTKPDVAAPGVNIWAPTTQNQYTWNSGTSVAAAYATGIVAMLLEWGIVRESIRVLPNVKIRSILTGGARRFPGVIYPLASWGFGILDFDNSINKAIRDEP